MDVSILFPRSTSSVPGSTNTQFSPLPATSSERMLRTSSQSYLPLRNRSAFLSRSSGKRTNQRIPSDSIAIESGILGVR